MSDRNESSNANELDNLHKQISDLLDRNRDLTREVAQRNVEADRLMNEMKSLKDDAEKKYNDYNDVKAEMRDYRKKVATLEEERDTLFTGYAELEAERDEWKTRAGTDPLGFNAKLNEYQGLIRGMKHERAFERVAKNLRVNDPVKYADLITLAKYEPEGDDPDEAKIAEKFSAVIAGRSWLVDSEPATQPPPAAPTPPVSAPSPGYSFPPVPTPPPGNGQGHAVLHGPASAPPAPNLPPAPGSDRGTSDQSQQVERPSGYVLGKM